MASKTLVKPLLRGHFHQAAFFSALGACTVLISKTPNSKNFIAALIYSLGLTGLLGVSALYHRPQWGPKARLWMRRLDHCAIFILIAGTSTPIAMLALPKDEGNKLLLIIWLLAAFGLLQSLFWVNAPKWLSAIFYVGMGLVASPYLPLVYLRLGSNDVALLCWGGGVYTTGALVYALKKPNPYPAVFGYHEIFHLMVLLAAICHFIVISKLVN